MKGNKEINVVDQTSATDGSNESYVDTKTSSSLKTDCTRVMTGNLNMNSRSKNYVSHRCMKAHMLLMLILSIQLSTIIIKKQLLIIIQKYVNDRLNQSVGSTDLENTFVYIKSKSGQFSDEDDITGLKFIDQDFHQFSKKNL